MTNKKQKLELTWIGKYEQPRLERLLEIEGKDVKGESGNVLFHN